MNYKFLLLCFFISFIGSSQNIKVNETDSYEIFVSLLTNSKDQKYQETLQKYDDYLVSHPNDVTVKVYRCKFIEKAYYDDYDDYNPHYEDAITCVDELYNLYPNMNQM